VLDQAAEHSVIKFHRVTTVN